jgi:DNA/RNA-binding domain of Phe-tRNA-synthetase-like protein
VDFRLKIDPKIIERFPNYTALIIYAHELENTVSEEASTLILRAAEQQQRSAFGEEKPTTHHHIAAWREAYKEFGLKPSKYPCSVEALLSRTLKGQDLPNINKIVDLYNSVSIKYVLPVGGEDWSTITSDLTLTFATGSEPFGIFQEGQEVTTYPEIGEVIWVDASGVTCRGWNWRQCVRTRLTENCRNVYFVLDRLAPFPLETLREAGQELIGYLRKISPNSVIEQEILGNTE